MSQEVNGKLKHRAQSRLQGCQHSALILRWNLNTGDILESESWKLKPIDVSVRQTSVCRWSQ